MIQAMKDFPSWAYQFTIYLAMFSIFAIILMRKFKRMIKDGKEGEGEAFGEKTVMALQNSFNQIFYSSIGIIAAIVVMFVIYFIIKIK